MMLLATIIDKFDLGYIVELPDHSTAQLRVIEMKGITLDYHLQRKDEQLFGQKVNVYTLRQSLVSEYSDAERAQRDDIEKQRQDALRSCSAGKYYTVQVIAIRDWGCICQTETGLLNGSLLTNHKHLQLYQSLEVMVDSFTKNGKPIFTLTTKLNDG
jgi:hypothetical protein